MNLILSCLKDLKVNDYRIVKTTTQSKEFFFIKKKLDMSRAKNVTKYHLTVYQTIYETNVKYKGSASCFIDDPGSYNDIMDAITSLVKEAKLVKNSFYDLPAPIQEEKVEEIKEKESIADVLNVALGFHESENLSLNSFELFDDYTTVQIVNSKGINVKYSYPTRDLEMIVNAKNEHHEIEVYHDMRFGTINSTDLIKQVGQARKNAVQRLEAVSNVDILPNIPVLISQTNTLQLYKYYLNQINAGRIYKKLSKQFIGSTIGPANLSMESLVRLEDSSKNIPYDKDGCPIQSLPLIQNGKVVNLWGENRFLQYLNVNEKTDVYNFKVLPGDLNIDEFKMKPHLELVSFSDFYCDLVTGDFSGEIRLGYYFDGEKTTTITTGSISGNLKENESTMMLSDTLEKMNYAVVPNAIALFKVKIAK